MSDFSELNLQELTIQELNEIDITKLRFEELDKLLDEVLKRADRIKNELSQLPEGDRNSLSERMAMGEELSNIGRLGKNICIEKFKIIRELADFKINSLIAKSSEENIDYIKALCEEVDGYTEKIGDNYVNAYERKRKMEVDEASKVGNKETGAGEVGDEEAGDEER